MKTTFIMEEIKSGLKLLGSANRPFPILYLKKC